MDDQYAAGFFDGEGCVLIERQSPRDGHPSPKHALLVTIGNTHLPILRALRAEYGGRIGLNRKATERHKAYWQWRLGPSLAVTFLNRIRPYLVEKEPQAWLALEYAAHHAEARRKPTEEDFALRDGFYYALQNAKRA